MRAPRWTRREPPTSTSPVQGHPSETAQEAVIREVRENRPGSDRSSYVYMHRLWHEESCKSMVFCCTVACEEPPSMTPGDGILACHWTPRRFAKQGAHYRLQRLLHLNYGRIARARVESTRSGVAAAASARVTTWTRHSVSRAAAAQKGESRAETVGGALHIKLVPVHACAAS